jgi:NDP-mannose synthase
MQAIILAGGLGERLRPFTQVIPKPLLPVGESTVLEIQIQSLKKYGCTELFIATNYKSKFVESFLIDKENFSLPVIFSKEETPLGTCGPVRLLKNRLKSHFLLMNGDILTTLDFSKLYQFALSSDSDLTVVTKELITPFNFGRVISEGDYIIEVEEKPDFSFEILAGIYILKSSLISEIPENTYYGMDSLIKTMLSKNMKISKYLMKEYWLDIGRVEDYEIAQRAYKEHFEEI